MPVDDTVQPEPAGREPSNETPELDFGVHIPKNPRARLEVPFQPGLAGCELPGESSELDLRGYVQPTLSGSGPSNESPESDFWGRLQPELARGAPPDESPERDFWGSFKPGLAGVYFPTNLQSLTFGYSI